MNMPHVEEFPSPGRRLFVLSTKRHVDEHCQQYDLSHSLASKWSFLLYFLAQTEQLITIAFGIDGFTRLQQFVIEHALHILPTIPFGHGYTF